MNILMIRCLLVLPAVIAALGCDGRMPVAPSAPLESSTPQPSEQQRPLPAAPERFEVSGVVTSDQGAPLVGAKVTMATTAAYPEWPSVLTDASGAYRIIFSATTMNHTVGKFVARAEVTAPEYELYWRSLVATTSSTFNESFRLQRIQRVVAGRLMNVSFASDIGECPGWVAQVCGTVRITVPTQGNVTVDVVATGGGRPTLEACCVAGDEVQGNPITVPGDAGTEVEVRIGLRSGAPNAPSFVNQSFEVKTSVAPF